MFSEYFLTLSIEPQSIGIYLMLMLFCTAFGALVLHSIQRYMSGIQTRKLKPAARALLFSVIGYASFLLHLAGDSDFNQFMAIVGNIAFIACAFQVLATCLAIHTHKVILYLYQHQVGILTTLFMLFSFTSFIYPIDSLRPLVTFGVSLAFYLTGALYRLMYWPQTNFGERIVTLAFIYCTLTSFLPFAGDIGDVPAGVTAAIFISQLPTILAWFSGTLVALVSMHLKRIEELSDYDSLTNLTSERRFYERVSDLIQLVNRNKANSTMAEIQVDNLGQLSRRYGAAVEGLIMKSVGEVIQGSLRQTDIASRIDDSRLAVFMPFESREDALIAAKRISDRVDQLVLFSEKTPFTISVSIGMHQLELDEQVDSAIFQSHQQLIDAQQKGGHLIQMDVAPIGFVDHSLSA